MNVTLPSLLLFCLFSFLFGVVSAFLCALLRALFAALRLLPYKEDVCPPPHGAEEGDPTHEKKEGKRTTYALGYFFFDLFSAVLLSVAYLIFLYAQNGGIFRLYSLLLAGCGGLLLYRTARCVMYPLFFLLSRACTLTGRILLLPLLPLFRLLKKRKKKTHNVLDETEKIV